MAITKCPVCDRMVSDKAEKCPGCGATINISEDKLIKYVCKECGTTYKKNVDMCPECGCPTPKDENKEIQKVEVSKINVGIKFSDKAKRIAILSAIAVLVLIATVTISNIVSKKNKIKDYENNFRIAVSTMYDASVLAEEQASLIHDIWFNTIYEKDSYETDKYTKNKFGSFNDDFNTSLMNLMISDDYVEAAKKIKTSQDSSANIMKELKNPPEEYKEAYDALKEFYDAYLELANLAIDPSGNLSSYTEAYNEADQEVAKCYKKVKMYLD